MIYSAYLHGRLEVFDSLTKVSFGSVSALVSVMCEHLQIDSRDLLNQLAISVARLFITGARDFHYCDEVMNIVISDIVGLSMHTEMPQPPFSNRPILGVCEQRPLTTALGLRFAGAADGADLKRIVAIAPLELGVRHGGDNGIEVVPRVVVADQSTGVAHPEELLAENIERWQPLTAAGALNELGTLVERLIEQRRLRGVRNPYLIVTEDDRQVTKHMLRLRFDDARDKAITIARENGDGVLAARIRKFQFRDIRPKAASEILGLGDASRPLGHTDKRITETLYRRIVEIVKPTR